SLNQGRNGRWRLTFIELKCKRFPCSAFARDHSAAPFNSKANTAHERVHASSEITIITVGLFSTVRRKRYHHDEIIRRASLPAISPISRMTSPNPPACNNKSVAL